jgi:thiol-disulfide isomerase/thioredoxin
MRLTSCLITIALGLAELSARAQSADKAFRELSNSLENLSFLQYDLYREINNFKDNYFAKNSGTAYFEFDARKEGKLSRFQLRSDKVLQVYNGTEYFSLYESDKTYEAGKKKLSDLENLSLLYNSIATLRISIPLITADATVPKSIKDTVVEGKTYSLLKFSLHKKTLQFPSGFSGFDTEVTRYYELLIDPATKLPYIIIDRNSISGDQYFTKTVFTNLKTRPVAPASGSWFFSSYKGYSPQKEVQRNPLISVGASFPQWVLPEFKESGADSIYSSAFKGKKLMIEFWIKNCGYCMAAFPGMRSLQQKYGKNVDIVSVNAYDDKGEISFFYKREKPAYRMLYNGEKLANQLGVYGYPAVIITDEQGKVIYAQMGFNEKEVTKVLEN